MQDCSKKLSPWFDVKECPVHPGYYEILQWNKIASGFYKWDGRWIGIQIPFIKAWRGICGKTD